MSNVTGFVRRRRRDGYKASKSSVSHVVGVFRSNKHTYVYISDKDRVLFGVSSLSKGVPEKMKKANNVAMCEWLGNTVAAKLKEMKIQEVVFNKSGYRFHGGVKRVADSIREQGVRC